MSRHSPLGRTAASRRDFCPDDGQVPRRCTCWVRSPQRVLDRGSTHQHEVTTSACRRYERSVLLPCPSTIPTISNWRRRLALAGALARQCLHWGPTGVGICYFRSWSIFSAVIASVVPGLSTVTLKRRPFAQLLCPCSIQYLAFSKSKCDCGFDSVILDPPRKIGGDVATDGRVLEKRRSGLDRTSPAVCGESDEPVGAGSSAVSGTS